MKRLKRRISLTRITLSNFPLIQHATVLCGRLSKKFGTTPVFAVRRKYREIRWFKITEKGAEEIRLKEFEQGSPC